MKTLSLKGIRKIASLNKLKFFFNYNVPLNVLYV